MRVTSLIAAACLASNGLPGDHLAEAQVCTPTFGVVEAWGPVSATVLGTWDFNLDGRPDLLVQDGTSVRVALNSGEGSFELGPSVFEGSVAVGDFDGDGVLDLVGIEKNVSIPLVAFLKGDGHGGFRQLASFQASSALSHPVAGDFDGDGKLDLAGLASQGWVWWYRGDGRGGFGEPSGFQPGFVVPGVFGPFDLDVLDIDADGRDELLVWTSGFKTSGISAWALHADGVQWAEVNAPSAGGFECGSRIAFGDVDGDGRTDAVSANRYLGGCGNAIRTYLVRPRGGVQLDQGADPFAALALADFDGDGKIDLAALNLPTFAAAGLAVLRGDGKGTFGPASISAVPSLPYLDNATLTAVEIHGWPDLILSGLLGNSPRFLRNSCRRSHLVAPPGPPYSPRSHRAP